MIYLIFSYVLVINISVSRSALSCGDPPADYRPTNKITLIEFSNASNTLCNGHLDDHDDIHDLKADILNEMNCNFRNKCSEFYDIDTVKVDDINTTYEQTLQSLIRNNTNIINLFTNDYYNLKTNIDEKLVNNRIIYAADVYDAIDDSKLKAFYLSGDKVMDVPGAKIMSRRLAEENPDLFAFVTSMHFSANEVKSRESCLGVTETVRELSTVLVCSDEDEQIINAQKKELTHNALNFKFVPTVKCNTTLAMFKNRLFAVVAPFPFETDHDCLLPTIFYSRYEDYKSHGWLFPNSVNLFSSESPGILKHAYMKVIMDAGWHRIAVISDYSSFSMEFEEGLLPLLAKERKLFNVHRCRDEYCFKKALIELEHMEAKLIIVNVDRENALKLYNIYKGTVKKNFWMIFRVKPFWGNVSTQLISITMGPDDEISSDCNNFCHTHGNAANCHAIVTSLTMVADTHNQLRMIGKSKLKYFKKFTKTLTRNLPESVAYLTRTEEYIVARMKISHSGVVHTIPSSYAPFKNMPREKSCYIQRSKFDDPCNINIVLLFMFVIIVFSIIILTITCYFENSSPLISKKYQQL